MKNLGKSDVGELMEALRKKLGAKVILCAIYITDNGKTRVVTHPGMDDETAKRCAMAVAEALRDIQIVDLEAMRN